jgi:molybdenum cofactor cytidylyltransferase
MHSESRLLDAEQRCLIVVHRALQGARSMAQSSPKGGAVAGIVLAAGRSSRARPRNKLLHAIGGKAMVRRVAETALAAGLAPVIVVTGFAADKIRAALTGLDVAFVHNDDFAAGMGGSIGVGVGALPTSAEACIILLADMPDVKPSTVAALVGAFDAAAGKDICVPAAGGRRGNPVLFGRAHFAALRAIAGDRGGKEIVAAHAANVAEVAVEDVGVLADYDTLPSAGPRKR